MNNGHKFYLDMEKQVRASLEYADWVKRNKGVACLRCDATVNLECHHIPELYQTILGLYKYHGDRDAVIVDAKDMHVKDKFETATLCQSCHAKKHPGRVAILRAKVNTQPTIWTCMPRHLDIPFTHSTRIRPKGVLGLISFQTLLGMNWYIMNGHLDSRIVEFNRRQFAKLLGKNPSTSFNRSLEEALHTLKEVNVLSGHHRTGNKVEAIFEPEYLKKMGENPWFMPLEDIKTDSMCVLTIRWFLSFQSNRKTYQCGLEKLKGHLGIHVINKAMAIKALRRACEAIDWANVSVGEEDVCTFALKRRGATPIFQLRDVLRDALER